MASDVQGQAAGAVPHDDGDRVVLENVVRNPEEDRMTGISVEDAVASPPLLPTAPAPVVGTPSSSTGAPIIWSSASSSVSATLPSNALQSSSQSLESPVYAAVCDSDASRSSLLDAGAPEGVYATSPCSAAETDLVREKYRWLCLEDQKTVCRRECQNALKREEALVKQLQQTAESYAQALEMCRSLGDPDGQGPVLSPDLVAKYEDRMRLLRGTIAALQVEPCVSLPPLSKLESAKGFVFSSYAQTAQTTKVLGDLTGATDTVTAAASSARASLSRFFRNSAPGVGDISVPAARGRGG